MFHSHQSDTGNSPLVAPLAQFQRTDIQSAGGKGANLGELSRADFEIPPGFVITTVAYDLLLRKNDLHSQIDKILKDLDFDDPTSVRLISKRIRELLQGVPYPDPIAAEVLSAYHQLGVDAVAVRSSATAEDLPEAAFAGQQETFLNVQGDQALLEAVQACWASLWTERALLYRARQGIDQGTVKSVISLQRCWDWAAYGCYLRWRAASTNLAPC
jgi:pyruvate,water dikinase